MQSRSVKKNGLVWRYSAMLLLAFFVALVTLPSVFAFAQDEDASLPACCRMHGKHRCSMGSTFMAHTSHEHGDTVTRFTEKCPCIPVAQTGTHSEILSLATVCFTFAGLSAYGASAPTTDTGYRKKQRGTHPKRGPPILS